MSVNIKILFFAKARELSGNKESFLVTAPVISYSSLFDRVVNEFSLDAIKTNIILAVNEEYILEDACLHLKEGDVIAIIPPLSGATITLMHYDALPRKVDILLKEKVPLHSGFKMNFIDLINDELNINEIVNKVKSPKCGAVSLFIGTTRDNFNNNEVLHLCYEAYEPMAKKIMLNTCDEIRAKWSNVENIAVYHRLGTVAVTEASVVIAISSPHRADSLEAVNFAINKLKECVPIWKKEVYKNASLNEEWKKNEECLWRFPQT